MSAGKLNVEKVKYVSARAQFREEQLLEPLFTEEELAVFKRGRNASKASVAKHASPEEYRASTGFECLLGWLYLTGQMARVEEPPARPRPVPRCLPPAGGGSVLTSSPSPLRLEVRCSAASGAQRTAPQCLMPIVSCFGPFVQENGAELRKYEEILIQTIDISRRLWYIPIRLFD